MAKWNGKNAKKQKYSISCSTLFLHVLVIDFGQIFLEYGFS